MKLIKKKNEKRRDYIFQKDRLTILGARFVSSVLVLLIVAVASTYFDLV
ncbi:hypothetical protein J4050_13100 [Winogradskyella sp. DF17]|jgi:hypothetical protein|uniref:Uncharacterized protein n=1 Tax=Winogradskyella pelagia TaxID=2819984 RepID=A0ABS3T4M3_9FLAO|nr:hypothetical protein [Winogradskyella sp. DF17]MBO3117687.1 hypothetical protein [Winogradskyella sp. DF17]